MVGSIFSVDGFGDVEVNFSLRANRQIQKEGTKELTEMGLMESGTVASVGYFVNSMVFRTQQPGTKQVVVNPNDAMIDIVFKHALKLPEGKDVDDLIDAWMETGEGYVSLAIKVMEYFRNKYQNRPKMDKKTTEKENGGQSKNTGMSKKKQD